MEVIHPSRREARQPFARVIAGTVVGTLLVVIGLVFGYVVFATPLLRSALPGASPDAGQVMTGVALWAFALVAPAVCLIAGLTRLARILADQRRTRGHRSPVLEALGAMPDDVVVATGIVLADGRGISDLVVGPFGAAVIRELPPASVTRIRDGHWEARGRRSWIPLEDPLERAARDAERVRRWLAHDDVDFVVKTYAAVVGPDATVPRTSWCAVLTPDQVAAWIAALPPQRSLTPSRREQLVATVRAAADT
jgi:hypothetical protein